MGHKGIMLLRRDAGKGLKPVGIMGRPVLHRPVLHGLGHHVRHGRRKLAALIHNFCNFIIDALGQPLSHG